MSRGARAVVLWLLDANAGEWLAVPKLGEWAALPVDQVRGHLLVLSVDGMARIRRDADGLICHATAAPGASEPVPGLQPFPPLESTPAPETAYRRRSADRPLPHQPTDWGTLGAPSSPAQPQEAPLQTTP